MLRANYEALALAQQNFTATGLPFAVGAVSRATFNFSNIVVPRDEYWAVSFAGVRLDVDDVDLFPEAAAALITFPTGASWVEGTGSGTLIPVPTQIYRDQDTTTPTHFISIFLAGIELMPGDIIAFTTQVFNADTLSTRNIIAVGGGIRYRPFRLVSEQAVALLDRSRVDTGLDQRLRSVRG